MPSSRCAPQRDAGVCPGKLKLGSFVQPARMCICTLKTLLLLLLLQYGSLPKPLQAALICKLWDHDAFRTALHTAFSLGKGTFSSTRASSSQIMHYAAQFMLQRATFCSMHCTDKNVAHREI